MLRRLRAKCAHSFVIKRRSEELQPAQVGVGVSGGAEAIIHATRRLMLSLPDNHVFVKLDFSNAFNSVRRDTILANVAVRMPKLYQIVKESLDCNPMLIYGDDIIISAEGSQHGDPLTGLESCEFIQLTLLETAVRTTMGFVDDINLEGELSSVARDIQAIIDSNPTTRLVLKAISARLRQRTSK